MKALFETQEGTCAACKRAGTVVVYADPDVDDAYVALCVECVRDALSTLEALTPKPVAT